jgi:adenylylsulfate kinase-like enzyme
VWFTGLSGAGKSTIARAVEADLLGQGIAVEVLDGDSIRQTLSRGLGFSKHDRDENVRRVAYVAGLLARHGVVVLVALIRPIATLEKKCATRSQAPRCRFWRYTSTLPRCLRGARSQGFISQSQAWRDSFLHRP